MVSGLNARDNSQHLPDNLPNKAPEANGQETGSLPVSRITQSSGPSWWGRLLIGVAPTLRNVAPVLLTAAATSIALKVGLVALLASTLGISPILVTAMTLVVAALVFDGIVGLLYGCVQHFSSRGEDKNPYREISSQDQEAQLKKRQAILNQKQEAWLNKSTKPFLEANTLEERKEVLEQKMGELAQVPYVRSLLLTRLVTHHPDETIEVTVFIASGGSSNEILSWVTGTLAGVTLLEGVSSRHGVLRAIFFADSVTEEEQFTFVEHLLDFHRAQDTKGDRPEWMPSPESIESVLCSLFREIMLSTAAGDAEKREKFLDKIAAQGEKYCQALGRLLGDEEGFVNLIKERGTFEAASPDEKDARIQAIFNRY